MAREVDPVRKRQRDQFIAAIAFAGGDCDALKDKGGDVRSRVRGIVDESIPDGQRLARDVVGCIEALVQAMNHLNEARNLAHAVDITIEVPDPEPGG